MNRGSEQFSNPLPLDPLHRRTGCSVRPPLKPRQCDGVPEDGLTALRFPASMRGRDIFSTHRVSRKALAATTPASNSDSDENPVGSRGRFVAPDELRL